MPLLPRFLKLVLLVCVCITITDDASKSFAQSSSEIKKIQVLHGSSDVGYWRKSFDTALHEYIVENSNEFNSLRLAIEYTGINEMPADADLSPLIGLLSSRQQNDPADIVIAVLPPSARFLEDFGDEIYPGVQRLYVSSQIGNSELVDDANDALIHSMEGDMDAYVFENIELIPRLVPNITDLYVLSGAGTYGGILEASVRNSIADSALDANIHFIRGAPVESLAATIEQEGQISAAMLLSYEQDLAGNNVNTQDVLQEIVAATEVPVFGIFDTVLGRGIVGGYMTRAQDTAHRVGAAAYSILFDRSFDQSAVPYSFIFDGRQLERLNIDRNLIPENSLIDFESFSVWQNYRSEILTALFVIGLQAILIILLFGSLKRQREAESILTQQTQDLSVQKNLFESVINSIPDAVLICRVDRTIYAANKSTEEVFGLALEEIIGLKTGELIAYESEDQRLAEDRMLDSTDEVLEPIILRFKKSDGSLFTGEMVGTKIISSNDEVLGYFSLVRDVTKRLSQEQEERQSQKMEALGTLVGGIAHDFNNVLGVISAYAELLSFDEETEDGRLNIEKILKATNRGSDLCNQIMSFSRDMSVEQKPTNLFDVANETIKLLAATIPSRIEIDFKFSAGEFPLYGNSTQLQQVLLNLATNANHAIGDKPGTISIAIDKAEITNKLYLAQGVVDQGNYVLLKVIDNGCGISGENFDRIFEPFYTTKKSEGTGMGMAMVYKIVRAHNGVIDIKSEVGEGTEVCIYFPRYDALQYLDPESQSNNVIKGNGEHIMLVDDEVELLESVERILQGIGYDVDAYSDSREALKSFSREPKKYDLLISDQVMPGINGIGLMQSMRELRQDLPVILCTGYSEVLDKKYEYNSDISSVMRKPFTAADLSHSIDRALAQ